MWPSFIVSFHYQRAFPVPTGYSKQAATDHGSTVVHIEDARTPITSIAEVGVEKSSCTRTIRADTTTPMPVVDLCI